MFHLRAWPSRRQPRNGVTGACRRAAGNSSGARSAVRRANAGQRLRRRSGCMGRFRRADSPRSMAAGAPKPRPASSAARARHGQDVSDSCGERPVATCSPRLLLLLEGGGLSQPEGKTAGIGCYCSRPAGQKRRKQRRSRPGLSAASLPPGADWEAACSRRRWLSSHRVSSGSKHRPGPCSSANAGFAA